jgi:hypothetical protein
LSLSIAALGVDTHDHNIFLKSCLPLFVWIDGNCGYSFEDSGQRILGGGTGSISNQGPVLASCFDGLVGMIIRRCTLTVLDDVKRWSLPVLKMSSSKFKKDAAYQMAAKILITSLARSVAVERCCMIQLDQVLR